MTTTTKTYRNKLSVRKGTIFKKSCSSCSSSFSSLYKRREKTFLKKAYELSELCGVDVCIICYDREGNLVKTWPEDKAKVRLMAERFSRLNEQERNKKSTNLSRFLNKKMIDEKKTSLKENDNRFSQKVLEIKDSFQEKLRQLLQVPQNDQTVVSTDLSLNSSLIDVDHQPLSNHPSTTESSADLSTEWSSSSLNHARNFPILLHNHENGADLSTECSSSSLNHPSNFPILLHNHENGADLSTEWSLSSLNHPSNFSILLHNHEDGTFTQLANSSAPRFEEEAIQDNQDYYGTNYLDLLLGVKGMRSCNNFDLPMSTIPPVPLMETQTPLFQQFDHQFMQTQPFGNPTPYFGMMLS